MIHRLKNRFLWLREQLEFIALFGFKLWTTKKVASKIYAKDREKGLLWIEKKHRLILDYIDKHYGNMIYSNVAAEDIKKITPDCTIWTCWWQGEENAPEIVKACINSMRKHAGSHNVVVIDWNNFQDYVQIPEIIIESCRIDGTILPAHLADLLRCKLLDKYGGIWCDATLFLSDDLNPEIYDYSFFTIKHPLALAQHLEHEPSKCVWRIFFMCAGQGNPLVKYTGDILESWLKSGIPLIQYWTMDYIILLMYEKNEMIKQMIDEVPQNNEYPYWLSDHMNSNYNKVELSQFLGRQHLHKLSWKVKPVGTNTIYTELVKK